jgi:hypothetical protein
MSSSRRCFIYRYTEAFHAFSFAEYVNTYLIGDKIGNVNEQENTLIRLITLLLRSFAGIASLKKRVVSCVFAMYIPIGGGQFSHLLIINCIGSGNCFLSSSSDQTYADTSYPYPHA